MPIKAVTFDFWSTLYKPKNVDYNERLRQLKSSIETNAQTAFSLEQFRGAVGVARATWEQTWKEAHRTITADEWLSIILEELDVHIDSDYLAAMIEQMENNVLRDRPTLVPEAHTVLSDLANHYRLAIISDTGTTPGRVLRKILAEDDMLGYFTHLTFSDEIGLSKPHPEAFMSTLKALETVPSQGVHIGDLLRTDIDGAQGVGMRGVQYVALNQDDWQHPERNVVPDAVIQNHHELKDLIENWGTS